MGRFEDTIETAVEREAFVHRLQEREVPEELIHEAWGIVRGLALGLLLYGSYARREAKEHSDLDLLLLSDERPGIPTPGKVSVTFYSTTQLRKAQRTLYGMHLSRDGIILHDSCGELTRIMSTFSPPDPTQLLRRVQEFAMILDVTNDERLRYLAGLTQVARYLLRTATYALALHDGAPCFSVEELSIRFRQPELSTLLSSHSNVAPEPTSELLSDLISRLKATVGPLPKNPYGSLHALIVGMSTEDSDISHLATFALGTDEALPYSEIPKVIL
ncbi:nucleotidyltransferase domain-containing protein [Saccharomonospora azurea]|uniref:nucleotidyltransferase domain-containing protein n=1 Tax=Saccharomonospora azurea TaxID=40988 RepID=UPI003D8C9675